jgi:hypothetical protein
MAHSVAIVALDWVTSSVYGIYFHSIKVALLCLSVIAKDGFPVLTVLENNIFTPFGQLDCLS